MAELNKSALKLTSILDLTLDQIKKLYDVISLHDQAALQIALNSDDKEAIKSIYSKYSSSLSSLPSSEEVQNFYHEQIQDNARDADEALADTADHFGITGEQVQELLGDVTESLASHKDVPCHLCHGAGRREIDGEEKVCMDCDGLGDMPYQRFLTYKHVDEAMDSEVLACIENIKEMLKGGKSKGLVCELNTWQRRMMYGYVPDVVSKVMQKTLDMTPVALMQKNAEIEGVGETSIHESDLTLHQMMEKIIESELNGIIVNEASKEQKYKGWTLRVVPQGKTFAGIALYDKNPKHVFLRSEIKNSEEEVVAELKALVDEKLGEKEVSGKRVAIDFNTSFARDLIGHHDDIWAKIISKNGKPVLMFSTRPAEGLTRAVNRSGPNRDKLTSGQGFSMSVSTAKEAGLKHARYALGMEIDSGMPHVSAYELDIHSAVNPGEKIPLKGPGITVVPLQTHNESINTLVKEILNKKF